MSGSPNPGTPVVGSTADWEQVRSVHAAVITVNDVSGGPSSFGGTFSATLNGSLDGVNWYPVATTSSYTTGGTGLVVSTGTQPARYVQAVAVANTEGYGSGSQPGPLTGTVSVLVVSQ